MNSLAPRYSYSHAWPADRVPFAPMNGDIWRGSMRVSDKWMPPHDDADPCWNEAWATENDEDIAWARTMWYCPCSKCDVTDA